MAQNRSHRGGSLAHPSWEVQVTVTPGPRYHRFGEGIPRVAALPRSRLTLLIAAVVLAGVVAAPVALLEHGGAAVSRASGIAGNVTAGARGTHPAHVATPGTSGVYRYPLGCLGSSISAGDSTYGGGRVDHGSPCWRYGVYVTAIFTRTGGVWGMGLEAISPSCPAVALPAPVRAQLAVCRRPASSGTGRGLKDLQRP